MTALAAATSLVAQAGGAGTNPQPFHFDLASIRPDPPDTRGMTFWFTDDGVVINGVPIEFLVQQAFGVQAEQITGLPAWAKTVGYTIRAKVDDADAPRWKALAPQQREQRGRSALQGLLADRFNFRAHPVMQERAAYCLVVAKHGPKFHAATPGDTYPSGPKMLSGMPLHHGVTIGNGTLTMQGEGIATLIKALSSLDLGSPMKNQDLDHPIEDRTGLTGEYDLSLRWAPGNMPAPDSSEPALFTALQEQLGLKLELRKVPVETIFVDHIDRPSPN